MAVLKTTNQAGPVHIETLADIYIDGQVVQEGQIVQVNAAIGQRLVYSGRAKYVQAEPEESKPAKAKKTERATAKVQRED